MFIPPSYSSGAVNRAGDDVRAKINAQRADRVIENWRSAHTYVINTFQARVRRIARDYDCVVATRLKRKNTIYDKLFRQPEMNLSRMHDIAGCRVIFRTIEDLQSFRQKVLNTRAKHKLVSVDERTGAHKYDYLTKSKESGYRGIHDVYKFVSLSPIGKQWDGLRIEIQYRTQVQHAWATAVEVLDLITKDRIKYSQAKTGFLDWFRVASEMLSRVHENQFGPMPEVSNSELLEIYRAHEEISRIFTIFKQLPNNQKTTLNAKNIVLIYEYNKYGTPEDPLQILSYENFAEALDGYFEAERKYGDKADVVFVRPTSILNLKSAFRNYFLDVGDFVQLMDEAIIGLA